MSKELQPDFIRATINARRIDAQTIISLIEINDEACQKLLVLKALLLAAGTEPVRSYALEQIDQIYDGLNLGSGESDSFEAQYSETTK